MAKFCDEECKDTGGICDFCENYVDKYVIMGNGKFAGEGFCKAKNEEVFAHDGCNDDFHCVLVTEEN